MWFGRWLPAGRNRFKHSDGRTFVEGLEPRCLLAAAVIQGYTPAEIRHAYGFDQIALPGGASADGSGQTIAIVDAFNNPDIASDLAVFDQQFGLEPANLKVVDQTGGASLPETDAGWAGEIALDVEWAHAIAPGAQILLVEANSSSVDDLMSAVDYARNVAGVSTVSMSWGGSEFFSWEGGESASQTNFDPIFTTPSAHQGVTFIASAGDSGAQSGVMWPSSSTNVISVGGTSLYTTDASGTYDTEVGWSGTNGGFSQVEAEPTYQQVAQTTGVRTTPDVSYDADPNTGFAVYDSVAFDGTSGWQEVGGTSAGAPQWAALIAIANQGRALNGFDTLDGANQTLPALYETYAGATTQAGYAAYTSAFDDVLTGGGTIYRHRYGGFVQTGYTAQAGYDLVTGLGSPKAAAMVASLLATSPTPAAGGSGSSGGDSSGSPSTPASLAASPISGTFVTSPDASVLEGDNGSLKLKLKNTSGANFTGPVTITLFTSTDANISGDDSKVLTKTIPDLHLKSGKSKTIKLHFDYPTNVADGTYDLVASIAATDTNTAAATAVALTPVTMDAPAIDLSTGFVDNDNVITVKPGHSGVTSVTILNLGNTTAKGTLTFNLFASSDETVDGSDDLLKTIVKHKIKIRAGESITFHVHFRAPANRAAGSYNMIATATSTAQPADDDPVNNKSVIGTSAV